MSAARTIAGAFREVLGRRKARRVNPWPKCPRCFHRFEPPPCPGCRSCPSCVDRCDECGDCMRVCPGDCRDPERVPG